MNGLVPQALAHDIHGPAFVHASYAAQKTGRPHPSEVPWFRSRDLRLECMLGAKNEAVVQLTDPAYGSSDASVDGVVQGNNLWESDVLVHLVQSAVGTVFLVLHSSPRVFVI